MSGFEVYKTSKFEEISARLNEACAWLEELGIECPKTRIGKYQKLFATLAKHQKDGTLAEAAHEIPVDEYVNAGFETYRLFYIYERLKNRNTAGLEEKLKHSIRGHHLYVLDKEDSSGRDFTFELTAAAMFGPVADSIQLDHQADVVAVVDRMPIFVECKRLKSRGKVGKRIKEGLEQLEERYRKAENPWAARGILALSIDKIMNPEFKAPSANSQEQVGQLMRLATDAFVQEYRRMWRDARVRTLGIAIVMESPARNASTNLITMASQITMESLRPTWSPEFEWLKVLERGATSG